MLRQYSLSLKTRFSLRLIVFVFMMVLNIVFAICGLTGLYGNIKVTGEIIAVTFSSITFCVWLVVCILADHEIIKSLFSAPKGYHIFLAPVAGWKILLGRVAAILTWDIPGFVLGVIGIVIQSFILSDLPFSKLFEMANPGTEILMILTGILMFVLLILTIFLIAALTKSIFFSMKARAFLGILGGILISYLLSFLELILIPFTAVSRYGVFLTLHISSGDYLAIGIYLILNVLKAAILFYITSYLMERKMNI